MKIIFIDCCFVMPTGSVLHHDDSTTDRSPGSDRNNNEAKTKALWMKEFQEKLAIPGTMYRGESPVGQMADFNLNSFVEGAPHEFHFIVNGVDLQCEADMKDKLCIELIIISDRSMLSGENIGSFKPDNGGYTWEKVGMSFPADIFSKKYYSLKVNVIKKGKLKFVLPNKTLHR